MIFPFSPFTREDTEVLASVHVDPVAVERAQFRKFQILPVCFGQGREVQVPGLSVERTLGYERRDTRSLLISDLDKPERGEERLRIILGPDTDQVPPCRELLCAEGYMD